MVSVVSAVTSVGGVGGRVVRVRVVLCEYEAGFYLDAVVGLRVQLL